MVTHHVHPTVVQHVGSEFEGSTDTRYRSSKAFSGCHDPALMDAIRGLDLYHPSETSREIARLAPHAQLVEQWKQSPEAVWARFACVLGGEPEADRGGGLDVQGLAPS